MSSFFQIKSPLSRGSHVDLDDSLRTKQTLRGLGFFKTPSYGLTPYPDEPLFEAIEGFQRRHGLKVDGVMKPGGETAKAINKSLSQVVKQPVDIAGATHKCTRCGAPHEGIYSPYICWQCWKKLYG